MIKLTTEKTTATAPTLDLSPELQQRLHAAITQYVGLAEQIDLLEELADAEKAVVMALLEEAGADKLQHSGAYLNVIRGTDSRLNKKKLVALGVTEAQIAMATTTKPKRPYVTIETEAQRAKKAAKRAAGKAAGDDNDD